MRARFPRNESADLQQCWTLSTIGLNVEEGLGSPAKRLVTTQPSMADISLRPSD